MFIGAPPEDGQLVPAYIMNASEFPVYDVQAWYLDGHIISPDNLGDILPGQGRNVSRLTAAADALTGVHCTFRDAEGINWMRSPGGQFRKRRNLAPTDDILDPVPPSVPPGTAGRRLFRHPRLLT